jgi:hypothetical protein
MEIGDIIITFVMRYEKKVPNPIVKQEEELRNIRYSKTYTGY